MIVCLNIADSNQHYLFEILIKFAITESSKLQFTSSNLIWHNIFNKVQVYFI